MRLIVNSRSPSRRVGTRALTPLPVRLLAVYAFAWASAVFAQSEPVVLKLERSLGAHRGDGLVATPLYARADHMQPASKDVDVEGAVVYRVAISLTPAPR